MVEIWEGWSGGGNIWFDGGVIPQGGRDGMWTGRVRGCGGGYMWVRGECGVVCGGYGCLKNTPWYGYVGGWVWRISWGDGESRFNRCWFESWDIMLITRSFIVCNITVWNDVKRWFIVSIIVSLCICSCVATYFLKKASISSLNIILCFSNILRKSSWEKDDTMVEASFVTEAVADVVL